MITMPLRVFFYTSLEKHLLYFKAQSLVAFFGSLPHHQERERKRMRAKRERESERPAFLLSRESRRDLRRDLRPLLPVVCCCPRCPAIRCCPCFLCFRAAGHDGQGHPILALLPCSPWPCWPWSRPHGHTYSMLKAMVMAMAMPHARARALSHTLKTCKICKIIIRHLATCSRHSSCT